jgi:hypothetical protein
MRTFKESETSSDQRKAADRPKGHAAPIKNKTRDLQVELAKQSLVLSNKAFY